MTYLLLPEGNHCAFIRQHRKCGETIKNMLQVMHFNQHNAFLVVAPTLEPAASSCQAGFDT